jgi:hypothetical protein
MRWLDRDQPDLEATRKSVSRIERDAGRAGNVIHGLRALAKKSGPRLTSLYIDDAIQEVLTLTHGELQSRGVALHTSLSAADRPIVGDRVQLQQLVLNLILNGADLPEHYRRAWRAVLGDASGALRDCAQVYGAPSCLRVGAQSSPDSFSLDSFSLEAPHALGCANAQTFPGLLLSFSTMVIARSPAKISITG